MNALELERKERSKIARAFYLIGGLVFTSLGIIGIILPILPTTPFLLLAAACFAIGSERLYNWLLNNKILGLYIRNYKDGKGMPIKLKIFTISLLWITIIISILFFIDILLVEIILLIIAVAVSIHIILIRPKFKSEQDILGLP